MSSCATNGPDAGAELPEMVVNQGHAARARTDLTIEFVRESRFTLLQVANNPGIPIFWAAAFLLVGRPGHYVLLPSSAHPRHLRSGRPDGATQLAMAPLAKRDWSGQRDFRNAVDRRFRNGSIPTFAIQRA